MKNGRNWVSFVIIHVIFVGFWGALIEIPEKNGFPATLGYVVWAMTMIPAAVLALIVNKWKLEHDFKSIFLGLCVGVLGASGQLVLFFTLRIAPAYLVFPLLAMTPVVTILLAVMLLREKTGRLGWLGIMVAIIALLLLSYQPPGETTANGYLWMGLAAIPLIAWGTQGYIMRFANETMKAESIFFYMALASIVLIPVALFMTDFSQPINMGFKGPYLAALIQILNAFGALCLVYAFRYGKAIIIAPMTTALSPVLTVIISLIIYAYIPHPIIIAGMVLAILSAVMMGIEETRTEGTTKADKIKVKSTPLFLLTVLACLLTFDIAGQQQPDAGKKSSPFVTPLRSRGFSLVPSPQQVDVRNQNVVIDGTWSVVSQVGNDHIASKRLLQGADDLHHLKFNSKGPNKITLKVQANTVKGITDATLNRQAYLLKITANGVEITGNEDVGLFYGVQSFLQLLRLDAAGNLIVPECEIRDWPSLELRVVHWDTKHHQKKIETLKRLIDWHAYFKVNMISFEMEDKYEYPSHPIIGAPGAYTKREMQDLTRYALERHIQLVPNIQSPAHMTYVLKHKEFAHLRSDNSNYQICMCDPEAINLIFDMYQDMIDATPGVEYFHVSTDEVYYAGICGKCKASYNEENRSLAWAEFAKKAHEWLSKRGRRMIAWVEYPLLPKHISMLPADIINGIGGNREFIVEENKVGMRQLAYSSTQGAELLFPNHFSTEYRGKRIEGRLEDISHTVTDVLAAGGKPIGTFAAAWDDAGLHEETFHLGWATVTQYGWTPFWPTVEQNVADFMDVFYGAGSQMLSVYKLSLEGARFFERSWDKIKSKERETGYGNSYGKGIGGGRTDELLSLPNIPTRETLEIQTAFSSRYASLITEAELMKEKNEALIHQINLSFSRVQRNHYNLEVLLSLAYLERYFIRTVLAMRDAEAFMVQAHESSIKGQPSAAVANLTAASNKVGELISFGSWMWTNLTSTWEKSRYEKNRSVGGRDFFHEMDDVKDHFADRRKGLDYMIAPFQRMDMHGWRAKLNERINEYARKHNVPVTGLKEERLED